MTDKPVKIPGPDHPITVEPTPGRVVVTVAGKVVADSASALTLREANYPPVLYLPMKDVDQSLLVPTSNYSYCPYKGDCSYYSIPAGGAKTENAVWSYRTPYDAVAQIKDHVAFYASRVDSIEQKPA